LMRTLDSAGVNTEGVTRSADRPDSEPAGAEADPDLAGRFSIRADREGGGIRLL
jgi:hypothetical protein